MITRGKTRLLLFGLLGFFAFVALTQWLSAPERPSTAVVKGSPNADGFADADTPPGLDTLDTVLLLYADGLTHVAQRYMDAESYETAVLLLKRVFMVRQNILGPEHPITAEAQLRYDEALRAQEDTVAGDAR